MTSILKIAHHSARRFPTFVIPANRDVDGYEKKPQNLDFWPETISEKDWIVAHTEKQNWDDRTNRNGRDIILYFYDPVLLECTRSVQLSAGAV